MRQTMENNKGHEFRSMEDAVEKINRACETEDKDIELAIAAMRYVMSNSPPEKVRGVTEEDIMVLDHLEAIDTFLDITEAGWDQSGNDSLLIYYGMVKSRVIDTAPQGAQPRSENWLQKVLAEFPAEYERDKYRCYMYVEFCKALVMDEHEAFEAVDKWQKIHCPTE